MADVRPFKAVRPDARYAPLVAALPYDVMNREEAFEMTRDKPYSFLHVDKAEIDLDPSVDPYDARVYEKANENLKKLIADEILIQDKTERYYIYRLTMDSRSQYGLVACASVDEYIDGKIKKHELTLEAKEQDRIRHVDMLDANTGPIFLAYRQREEIDAIVGDWTASNASVYDFTAEDGIGHTVWVVDDAAMIEKIRAAFDKVPELYIADGHHRNASAVKVALKRRQDAPSYDKNAEFNFYLAVIFPANQLKILSYNRAVKDLNGLTEEAFFEKVREKFSVSDGSRTPPGELHTFGMYIGGRWYKLSAKNAAIPDDPVGSLDVSILQNELLGPVLGIDDPRTNKRIGFVGGIRGLKELEKMVDSGGCAVAFAMYPTSLTELMDVADSGKIMPPKSTWFEPKLRSGLFIHKLT